MRDPASVDRMVTALNDRGHLFTRDQVADLMSLVLGSGDEERLAYRAGWEAGYWDRVAEENRAYPPPPYRVVPPVSEEARRVYRARVGVDRVVPRPDDFPGWGVEAVTRLRKGVSQ